MCLSFKTLMILQVMLRCYFRSQCEDKIAMILPFPVKFCDDNLFKCGDVVFQAFFSSLLIANLLDRVFDSSRLSIERLLHTHTHTHTLEKCNRLFYCPSKIYHKTAKQSKTHAIRRQKFVLRTHTSTTKLNL